MRCSKVAHAKVCRVRVRTTPRATKKQNPRRRPTIPSGLKAHRCKCLIPCGIRGGRAVKKEHASLHTLRGRTLLRINYRMTTVRPYSAFNRNLPPKGHHIESL